MKSIDTNIVLRVILNDDRRQAAAAERALAQPCFVGFGVLMEVSWVLRSSYAVSREAIADALATIVDMHTISTPDDPGVRWAIGRYRDHGADLADMLHIVASRGATAFLSFEKHLAKQAGDAPPLAIETLA